MGAGISPQLWDFSVRDPSVAAELSKAVGHRVQLHYTSTPESTNCFADTRYLVDRVTVTDNEPGAVPASRRPALPRRLPRRASRACPESRLALGKSPAGTRDLLGDADGGSQRQQSILAAHRRRAAGRR